MPEQLDAFPIAATALCAERPLFGPLRRVVRRDRKDFLALREAIDRYFRSRALTSDDPALLADLLDNLASVLRRSASEADLGTSTARSALRLLARPDDGRMKICPNCGWLFLDRSKNRSRAWCDMAVCGNRTKANRHYSRKKQEASP